MADEIKGTPPLGDTRTVDRDAEAGTAFGFSFESDTDKVFHNDFYGKSSDPANLQKTIREMEEKDPILPALMTVVLIPAGYPRQIEGEGEASDFVRDIFAGILNFNDVVRQMFNALKSGVQPFKLIWNESSKNYGKWKRWIITEIQDYSPSRFKLLADNTWEIEGNNGIYEKCNTQFSYKFLSYRVQYGNAYGESLYHYIYYLSKYVELVTKFWSTFQERLGTPHLIMSGTKEMPMLGVDRTQAIDFAKNLKAHTALVIPNPIESKLLEPSRDATGFKDFIDSMNSIKSLILTGRPDLAKILESGTYGKEQAMIYLRQDVEAEYINWIETFINDFIIRLLVDVNFGIQDEYPKWKIIRPDTVSNPVEFVNSMLTAAKLGCRIPVSYVERKLGIPQAAEGELLIKAPAVPAPFRQSDESNESDESAEYSEAKLKQFATFAEDMESLLEK